MKRLLLLSLITWILIPIQAQFVSLTPSSAGPEDEVVLTFDASAGNAELAGATKVYIHHGVVTDAPDGQDWKYVIGNWGQDDGVGEMTQVPGSPELWQLTLTPKDYYGLPDGRHAYWLAAVFRSANGNIKGTGTPGEIENGFIHTNLDFFIENPFVEDSLGETPVEPTGPFKASFYPNPLDENSALWIVGAEQPLVIDLLGPTGRRISTFSIPEPESDRFSVDIDRTQLEIGVYLIRIRHGEEQQTIKMIRGE